MKLNEDSIKWAINHICEYGDTDLFPHPVELKIIESDKELALEKLRDIDICGEYKFSAFRKFLIPKDELSYRVATQLNPVDSILFAAVIHQFGGLIEAKRASLDKVFSYRFAPESDGKLFSSNETWETYWAECEQKAMRYKYVAYLDISDFYNQISHHTIDNQLIGCGFPNQINKFIIGLLNFVNQKTSRGVPIGPHASHLLAELSLISIDESLNLKGFEYCRYVDDFVIFTNSYEEARMVFYHLAETLERQQRLVIQRQKSRIQESSEFTKICKKMQIDDPINPIEQDIIDVIKDNSEDPYLIIKLSDLKAEDLEVLSFENINSLLNEYISQKTPNYSRIRWLYRRLSQIGIEHAVDFSIANMQALIPAINDVCLYLSSASQYYQSDWKDIADKVFELLDIPIVKTNDYYRIVLLNLFVRNRKLNHISKLISLFNHSSSAIRRKVILTAAQNNAQAWIRELKESYEAFDDWNKNAYLIATACLEKEERKFLLQSIKERSNRNSKLEEIIIEWSKRK